MPGDGAGSTTSVQDTRLAWRTLRRSPGFTLTAILTLAFGIGVNIGMFRLVNGLLLRPLYERPEEVIGVSSRSTKPDGDCRGVSYPNYLDLREGTTSVFTDLSAASILFVGLDAGDGPRRTMASAVTANYFDVFGVPLALGRPFTRDEERPGANIRWRHHQPSALAATRGRRGDHRTNGTSQRRTVHHSRRRRRGIFRDLYSRT